MDEIPEQFQKSKYNSALAQLYRMDNLFQKASEAATQVQYSKWNEILTRLWLELIAKANKEEKEEIKKLQAQLMSLHIYGSLEALRRVNSILYSKVIIKQKDILEKKEEVIRLIQERQGKGGSYEEDIEDYMS